MTTKNFVVKNGLTTGNIILDASSSNITANVVVANLSVPATANLGAVGNITITGGSANYVLSTDGSGNLSWVGQSGGTPGGSNSYVQFNDNGSFGGNSGFTFDKYSNTLTVGNITTGTGSGGNISGVDYISANYVTASSNVTAGNILTNNLLYANGVAWNFSSGTTYSNANVAAYLPTYTGNISANYYSGNGSELFSITGANVTGTVSSATTAGTVTTAAQPNITSVGTLSSLTVTGLITATAGGIKVGNIQDTSGTNTIQLTNSDITVTGNITAGGGGTGNVTATYFIGNGSQLTGLPASYSNTNVAAYLPTYTGNFTAGNATITGAFSAANITTSGTSGNISGANVISANSFTATSTVNFVATSNVALGAVGNVHITGGSSGQYLQTDGSGTLTWADAGNATAIINGTSNVIVYNNGNVATSVSGNANVIIATGTGANVNGYLTVTGTFTAPNITTSGTSGNITGANYIVANYFQGNGSVLSNITGANVSGYVPLATSANTAGTVTVASQPNITSIGNLVNANIDGNLLVTGNLTVNGNTNYVNVDTLVIEDPIIEMGGGANGAPLTTNDGKDRGSLLHYYTTTPVDAFMGWDNSNGEFAFGSNVTVSSEVVTFNTLGNVRVGNIIGNGQALTGLTGSNVSGQVGNALVAGTVYTNAQPNITSVGTLTSLSVSGNITSGNIDGANAIVANYFIGDGSLLTGLPASYSNTNVENYLPTYTGNFSPSNLVVSTSANLGAVGNIIITGGSANYVLSTNGAGSLSWVEPPSGGNVVSTTISVDNFTGDGSNDTFTLSVTPTSVNSVFVNYNGAFVGRGSYELDGADLTFGSIPANGASIEVTTIEGLTIGSGAFTTRTATGDNSTVNYTVSSGSTVSSVLVTLDGVLQTPTSDYTISGSTLTFTTAPGTAVAIQIRELAVASSSGGGGGASNTSIRAQAMTMGIIFGG